MLLSAAPRRRQRTYVLTNDASSSFVARGLSFLEAPSSRVDGREGCGSRVVLRHRGAHVHRWHGFGAAVRQNHAWVPAIARNLAHGSTATDAPPPLPVGLSEAGHARAALAPSRTGARGHDRPRTSSARGVTVAQQLLWCAAESRPPSRVRAAKRCSSAAPSTIRCGRLFATQSEIIMPKPGRRATGRRGGRRLEKRRRPACGIRSCRSPAGTHRFAMWKFDDLRANWWRDW